MARPSKSEPHYGVVWDGRTVVVQPGRLAPMWVGEAVNKGPLTPGGMSRVHDTVHLFGDYGELVAVVQRGDYIMKNKTTGRLCKASASDIQRFWTQTEEGTFICQITPPQFKLTHQLYPRLRDEVGELELPHDQRYVCDIAERALATLSDDDRLALRRGDEYVERYISRSSPARATLVRFIQAHRR